MRKILFGFAASTLLIACASKTTTEVITDASDATTASSDMPKADIGEGKVIFLRDCSKCHYGKSIDAYTKEQWANILPRMVKKAQLDETEIRQINAYVAWKLEND